jgi:hypothetical protein
MNIMQATIVLGPCAEMNIDCRMDFWGWIIAWSAVLIYAGHALWSDYGSWGPGPTNTGEDPTPETAS